MNTIQNKWIIKEIFEEFAKGNDQPFLDAMAEDIQWHWMGTTEWNTSFKGKSAVLNQLWTGIRNTITQPFTVFAKRIIEDGDIVVIEAEGKNTTPDGRTYNNRYCWVCRMADGQIKELNEYMDTAHVSATFGS